MPPTKEANEEIFLSKIFPAFQLFQAGEQKYYLSEIRKLFEGTYTPKKSGTVEPKVPKKRGRPQKNPVDTEDEEEEESEDDEDNEDNDDTEEEEKDEDGKDKDDNGEEDQEDASSDGELPGPAELMEPNYSSPILKTRSGRRIRKKSQGLRKRVKFDKEVSNSDENAPYRPLSVS
ncbi:hypothetical protein PTTG_04570 [Puccinia triticina 1-1 BBBD Race 1]|uniref:Uncharacterized protein n=1 Tax=Puccinia triticina (isolate 1-1 / race 1 (BBBD)) TaxID=630390 RepID=A0A0C4EUT9_PUCT1|nr:hypothetical protein PTTG_04570 [Puccinia triticina 1-1 BBBD Race 1]